jgi:glycosyl transferase family 25
VVGTRVHLGKQIPVFVINLDRAPHRMAEMHERLNALGIAYERFAAVDGSTITDEDIGRIAPAKTWMGRRRPTKGEIGCFLSHRELLKKIEAEGYELACILEDDVELSRDFASFLDPTFELPANTGVLKLEIANPRPSLKIIEVSERVNSKLVFIPEGGEPGSAAYIVTRGGVKRLLADLAIMRDCYDGQAFDYWRHKACIYHALPLPARQVGNSEISRPHQSTKRRRSYIAKFGGRVLRKKMHAQEAISKIFYRLRNFPTLASLQEPHTTPANSGALL